MNPPCAAAASPVAIGLRVLVAGLAEVRVQVDEARGDDHPVRADAVRIGTLEPGDGFEDAAPNNDLAGALPTDGRIHQPRAADLEIDRRRAHELACVPASR